MPQQQRAIDTRRNALYGAAAVIDRRGYEAATIAEMVQESNITKGALYFHFSSKEAVAEAIVAEQGEWLSQHLVDGDAPVQSIVDLSYSFVDALRNDPLMRASIRMTIDRAAQPEAIARGYGAWISTVESLLRKARRAGSLQSTVRPAACAYSLTSAMTGLQLTSDALTGRSDLPDRAEQFWRLVIPAIVRPELVGDIDVRPPARRTRRARKATARV
ncbi:MULTISPECIES: ScbR family autoregulator-binding transcription factor [unclassified Knoellia]|uniref:ScbR family autoregulator-binding transcription factor n=1 Tax=Knoellia altitudinis TaxID=3404795 RepID=UPI00360F603E